MGNTLMGLGLLADPDLIFKRKFRWTFRVIGICGDDSKYITENFVKLASRPNLTIEETEINYLNAKMFIPGKGTWETVTVTYYDVAGADIPDITTNITSLWNWILSVYNFADPLEEQHIPMGASRKDYSGTGQLVLYDGCGNALEAWKLIAVWPQAVNFGELDYSSSEEVTIELTLRYMHAVYKSYCPTIIFDPCCTGCGTSTDGEMGISDETDGADGSGDTVDTVGGFGDADSGGGAVFG